MPDIDINALPADVEVLRAIIVANQLEHDKALKTERAKVSALEQHITNLEHQLAALRRARFGSSSEQLDEQIYQLELMLEELQSAKADRVVESEPASPENKPKPTARKPLPEHLPRETIEHGTHNGCEQCGHALSLIGEDVSEQLEYVPSSFRVIRHVRPKYSCTSCNSIVQASAPSRPIARGYAGPGLLAHVAVAKYCDHLPLYRQSAIYAREGVELERSTLADWVGQMSYLLRPLNNALRDYVLSASKLHGDDTPVPVLQPGRKTTKQGRLWGYLRDDRPAGNHAAPAVWFSYTPDRKGKWPATVAPCKLMAMPVTTHSTPRAE
jgi:transposase